MSFKQFIITFFLLIISTPILEEIYLKIKAWKSKKELDKELDKADELY